MKVLSVHNFYLRPGGEDAVFEAEQELLRQRGHQVRSYEVRNTLMANRHPLSVAISAIWSEESRRRLTEILYEEEPDVVHFHNTFPLISPSAYYACRTAGAAVIQTLHNYRLLCPVATLYRKGRVCLDCVGKPVAWPGVIHSCYHASHSQSAIIAAMLAVHRAIGTYQNMIDAYIVLTEFSRRRFREGGLPPHKLFVKPNAIASDPGKKQKTGDFALYIGRLSEEKGIRTMLSAWESLPMPLKIVGDGPMRDELLGRIAHSQSVQYLGAQSRTHVFSLMKEARVLIFPSEWYEGFPMVIAEAFACGLPVVTSNLGSQAEIVRDGFSGLHFHTADGSDLREKVRWCFHNPEEVLRMSAYSRREYEQKYAPEINYELLMQIYSKALMLSHAKTRTANRAKFG